MIVRSTPFSSNSTEAVCLYLFLAVKSFYNDKEEALKVLKSHKEARLKAFRTSEEAVYFYLNGPTEPVPTTAPKCE